MYKTKTYSSGTSITMADFFANSFLRTGFMVTIASFIGFIGRILADKIIYQKGTFLLFFIGGLIATFIINFFIQQSLHKGNINTLGLLSYINVIFFGFITGVTTSVYHIDLIGKALFITSIVFFSTATYGYLTKKDMSSLGVVVQILLIVIGVLSLTSIITGFFNKAWASWLFSIESFIAIIFNIIFIIYFMSVNKEIYNGYKHNHHMLQLYNIYSSYVIFTRILDLFLNILYLLGKEDRKKR